MSQLVLKNQGLEAIFVPEEGMKLASFKKGGTEVLHGDGRLIGPHFGSRNASILPRLKDESAWPEIVATAKQGIDPFIDGVARYAPWQAQASENTIKARISGKDVWHNLPLATLEGQQFIMEMQATLTADALAIDIAVVADSDAVVGLGYAYALPNGQGKITADVQDHYLDRMTPKPLLDEWNYDAQKRININSNKNISAIFHPFINPLSTAVTLETTTYKLQMSYKSKNGENSWFLARYAETPAIYICPIAAKFPFRPTLTVNSIHVELRIL